MARPTEYNLKICEEICERIQEGANIKDVLKSKPRKYPTFVTFSKWKRENIELLNLYISAQQDKAESFIEKIDEILEKVENKEMDPKVGRLMIYALQWKAAKFYPKMFAPSAKIDLTSKDKELTQQVVVMRIPDNGRDGGDKEEE